MLMRLGIFDQSNGRRLAHRLSMLKILWYAEPDEVKFEDMSNWISVIEDEEKTKLKAMELFVRIREMRLPTEHKAGVQTATDPAGGSVVLQNMEATTNTDTKTSIDTAGRCKTLTS